MKKISTAALLLLCAIGFAQDDDKKPNITVSPYYLWSEPTQYGLSFELHYSGTAGLEGSSSVLNVGYGTMRYDSPASDLNMDIDGEGYVIELGSRGYFNKKDYGIYSQNTLAYGNIKFEESGQRGTYSYFSFLSPTLGYKFKFGENLSIDPSVGVQWVIQMKGSGFVDNKNVDEWAGRFGIKVGYTF
jgi:hypothetical protein